MVEPRRIAQYQLLEQIGRGALGTVYRARDTVVNRLVAVKLIPLAGSEETRKSAYACLYREARTAGHLSHSGIVKLYTVGHEQGFAYIVMELVNGPTLGHWLSAKQQVDRTSALRLAGQIALALDHIHRHGFVHRDIKPSNIMIHDDGNVKITDFGIARLEISRKLTRTGFIVGTPPYMSPEQLQDEPLDGRSDQYSFGVVVYRMIAGRLPFLAATAPELCHKIVHEPPPPPGTFNPACGSALDAAILRALPRIPPAATPPAPTSCRPSKPHGPSWIGSAWTARRDSRTPRPSPRRPPPLRSLRRHALPRPGATLRSPANSQRNWT